MQVIMLETCVINTCSLMQKTNVIQRNAVSEFLNHNIETLNKTRTRTLL